jgi:hypothetical protein
MKLKTFKEFSLNESEMTNEEFLSNELDKIKAINTFEGLEELRIRFTFGYMPLNPIDPIRTVLREKIYELRDTDDNKDRYSMYLINLEGERKEINLPPGAMY